MKYIRHDSVGRIVEHISASFTQTDSQLIESDADEATHYIANLSTTRDVTLRPDSTVIVDKTTCTADGVDSINFSGIPINAEVTITGPGGSIFLAQSTTLQLTFMDTGTLQVQIKAFPIKDFNVEITAI